MQNPQTTNIDDFLAWVQAQPGARERDFRQMAWEALRFPGEVELTDEAIDFLDWPLTNDEVREIIPQAHVWKAIMNKAEADLEEIEGRGEPRALTALG